MPDKLIIDTDIGTDVDDAIALTYAIRSGIDIPLITTVHGNTTIRARIARKLVSLLGKDIPVVAGAEKPLKQPYIYWTGREGDGFLESSDADDIPTNSIDALVECIDTNRNKVSIACIAPLTNIATTFVHYPELTKYVNHLYLMGNALHCGSSFHLNYRAHNFKVDPEAADIVMGLGIPTTLVTTEICKRNFLTPDDIGQLAATSDTALTYIAQAAVSWMTWINYPVTYLYDPLVVHHHIDRTITTQQQYGSVSITTDVHNSFKEHVMATLRLRGGNTT